MDKKEKLNWCKIHRLVPGLPPAYYATLDKTQPLWIAVSSCTHAQGSEPREMG